jgi:hypothetical protein
MNSLHPETHMPEIHPVASSVAGAATRLNGVHRGAPVHEAPAADRAPDTIELSDQARRLESLEHPPVRENLVEQARALIASGEYPSDNQIEVALDRLIREISR